MAAPSACVTKVEIRVKCCDLLNKDVTSKSDPIVCALQETKHGWMELGRTERIKNTLNPDFTQPIAVDYYFEEVQKLRFEVYDVDNATKKLDDDDFLGRLECTLGQVVSSSPYSKALVKKDGTPIGKSVITIMAEEIKGSNDVANLTFSASKLDKKDTFGKSDPFLEISRLASGGSWQAVHRTEVIKNTLNPQWRPFSVPVRNLCSGNHEQRIKLTVYDWDDSSDSDLIGWVDTVTMGELLQAQNNQIDWPCINPKKQAKKKNYQNSGIIHLTLCKITKEYSFLDFVLAGLQLNFTVGIDFTGSNGDPRSPSSLHYINPYEPNEYMQAIHAVGTVCQDYDTDKYFPALGFGAKIPPENNVSHEFAINFNPANPFCPGIDGIIEAYKNCIQRVQLYGPTNVAPIIYHVAQFAAQAQQDPQAKAYYVLLLLTDGVLSDMADVKKAIVYSSNLPMSIIIIGVGSADFTDMNALDGDDGILRAPSGEPVKRDIVQFVPFRQFSKSSPAELARHVLAEVPGQVTQYFKMHSIPPLVSQGTQ